MGQLSRIQTPALGNSGAELGMRNRIINGAMVIDQRNAGASVTNIVGTVWPVDRFFLDCSQASKLTAQRNAGAVTPPAGFTNYLGITSSSAYSVAASDYFALDQRIEGFNIADLGWGTANAQAVTLSFRVYSSLTGTFGGAIRNATAGRSYPFTYSVAVANTWTTVSVTIPGDVSGTWATDNSTGMYVYFGLGIGSTYSGTPGAWASANYLSATGAVSVVGTSGATFYITGVQLEKGSNASPFEFRPYGTELALCQRYYYKYLNNGGGSGYYLTLSAYSTTSAAGKLFDFPVTMRAAATVTTSGTYTPLNATGSATTAFTGLGNSYANSYGAYVGGWTGSTGLTAGQAVIISMGNTAYIDASAEL